jgi:hypothetical protein
MDAACIHRHFVTCGVACDILSPLGGNIMALRFAVEFLKCVAIIVALPLGLGLFVQIVVLFVLLRLLGEGDIESAWGSAMAGIAAGALGLVIAVVIVVGRIADIED